MLSVQASCLEIQAFLGVNVTSFFLFKEREREEKKSNDRGKEVSEI